MHARPAGVGDPPLLQELHAPDRGGLAIGASPREIGTPSAFLTFDQRVLARVRASFDPVPFTGCAYISIAMRAGGSRRAYCASSHHKRFVREPQVNSQEQRPIMFVVRNSQSAAIARCPALAILALRPAPKLQLCIVDGIVSVTQQYWATSDHCAQGFSSDAA